MTWRRERAEKSSRAAPEASSPSIDRSSGPAAAAASPASSPAGLPPPLRVAGVSEGVVTRAWMLALPSSMGAMEAFLDQPPPLMPEQPGTTHTHTYAAYHVLY
jgi:hypothetical protein